MATHRIPADGIPLLPDEHEPADILERQGPEEHRVYDTEDRGG